MKSNRRFLCLLFVLLLTISTSMAQSFSQFMKRYGGEVIASLAHPTNTYSGCNYETDNGKLYVTVNYQEGYHTRIVVSAKGSIFYNLEVLSDSDFFPPFLASYGLKNTLYEALESETPQFIQDIESVIGNSIRDMDGKQLCCVMLTLRLLNYYAQYNQT